MVTGNKIRFLNIDILALTQNKLLHELNEGVFYTPNIDHLVKLQHDREFYNIYRQADWVVSDSQILYWLSKLLKHSLPEAIPGSSFFPAFYNYHANDPDCRIFLLGAAEGVASKAMENINMKVGRQIVVGAHSPTFGFEKDEKECCELIDIINASGATVLLVGVGAPKQEKWIAKYHNQMFNTLNPQLHSRSATYIKRNGLLIRKITIKSSRPFQCAYHPLTP